MKEAHDNDEPVSGSADSPAQTPSSAGAAAAPDGLGENPSGGTPTPALGEYSTTGPGVPDPTSPPPGPFPPAGPSVTRQFPATGSAPTGPTPSAGSESTGGLGVPTPPHGFPLGMPPIGGGGGMPPHTPPSVPPSRGRGWGRPVAVLVAAIVLGLGAGVGGGAIGYSLADNDDGHQSSPSALVSDDATLADVAAAVQPSVVSITTDSAEGSGVVYDADGYILTNNHVASSASNGKMEVAFSDGSTARATVVGTDPAGDLAVIKVDGVDDLTPITFGDSSGLAVGDTTLAVGSPLGLEGSVTSGIVSALDRTIQAGESGQSGSATTLSGLIQTDAAINPGNSGGALVNGRGELIGVNTAIATTGGSEGSVGVGFAIPSNTVKSTAQQLIDKGGVERAFLGVSVTDAVGAAGSTGAIITDVQSGSPADKAGLERGDVITEIGGDKIAGASAVAATVQSRQPGDEVKVGYTDSSGAAKTATVKLGTTE